MDIALEGSVEEKSLIYTYVYEHALLEDTQFICRERKHMGMEADSQHSLASKLEAKVPEPESRFSIIT